MQSKKRGQVTFYILVGIIFLLLVGLVSYIATLDSRQLSSEIGKNNNIDQKEVREYVESCLLDTARKGVFFNSMQGGYYNSPQPRLKMDRLNIPFYGIDGDYDYALPTVEMLESQLEKLIDENIINCFEGFSGFDDKKISVAVKNPKSDVQITNGVIEVSLNMHTEISGNKKSILEEYRVSFASDYYKYHSAVKEYIELQKASPDYIDFTDFYNIALKYGMTGLYEQDESRYDIIYFVFNDIDEVDDVFGSYLYIFAIDYSW